MNDQSINKVVQEKMKDMEVVENTRKKVTVDDLSSAVRRSTLDLPEVKKKYTAANTPAAAMAKDTASAPDQHSAPAAGEVKVKIVQAKDRAQDASAPANIRTVILDNEGLLGSQG